MLLSIAPSESQHCNWKIQMSFLMLGYSILSNIAFVLFTANVTLMDQVKVFCIISELLKLGICSAVIVQQQSQLFGVIASIEKLLNESNRYAFAFNMDLAQIFNEKLFQDCNMKHRMQCMMVQIDWLRKCAAFCILDL